MKNIATSLILTFVLVLNAYAIDVTITDFGAKTDADNNTEAIQKAFDHCSANGGGTVHVPTGTFNVSTIVLKDRVHLRLHAGAVLKAIPNPDLYRPRSVIAGINIKNASITGEGTIDGQGDHSNFQFGDGKGNRPHVVLLRECSDILIKDVSLVNSASWTVNLDRCDGVQVRGIKILSHGNHNCDGIDINSRNVVISDCIIDCDDDALCFKSEKEGYLVEHVTVTNCIIASNCNAIKFGTASLCGFRNIAISNCVIRKASESNIRKWKGQLRGISTDTTVLSGIALEVVDGGFMDRVVISNISMEDVQTPIFIRLGNRKGAGTLKNVILSGITARNESMMTSSITGIPGHYVENVTLRDILFDCTGGGEEKDASILVPEKENAYPENRMFGPVLPAYGFYVRHVKNLTFENVQCVLQSPDARPAFLFEDVHNLWLNNFQATTPTGQAPIVRLIGSSDVVVSGFRTQQTVPSLVKVEEGCKNIDIRLNDSGKIQKVQ